MSLYVKENPLYLSQSIDSILNQSLMPDEIVIVLDGPITNELYDVLNEFIEKNPTLFKLVKLEKNLGLGLALNEGLKACKNSLIARMDTDDIAYENRCEEQINEFLKNPSLDIIGTLTTEFSETIENSHFSRVVPEKHEDIVKFSKRRSPFNHPTVMYKKKSVEDVGGYKDILRNEDIDLFVRMIRNGSKAKNIQKQLLYFRSNKDNYIRRKSWTNNKNYILVIYNFWRHGHSSLFDLIYVVVMQLGMVVSPSWLVKYISDNFLRKKIN